MAPTPPTIPPGSIVAGDSLHWSRTFDDYSPADGWALSYTLVGATNVYTIAAEANDDATGFDVDLAASATTGYAAGLYKLVEVLTNAGSGDRVTFVTTTLTVGANLAATAAGGADTRSHAQKMLDAINAWLESKAPMAGSVELNGRKISYYPIADLLKLQGRYAAIVAREQTPPGQTTGTRILVQL